MLLYVMARISFQKGDNRAHGINKAKHVCESHDWGQRDVSVFLDIYNLLFTFFSYLTMAITLKTLSQMNRLKYFLFISDANTFSTSFFHGTDKLHGH